MPDVTVSGTRLYYTDEGAGEPLILLHGLNASHAMFKKEIEQLKQHFRVIALDARGHGQSEKPARYTLGDHIQDVLSLMDHLDIETAHILGVSMGSYIAQGVAAAEPQRVKKLLLVVPKSNGMTSSTQELLERHKEELQGLDVEEQLNVASKYIFHNLKAIGRWRHDNPDAQTTLSFEEQEAAKQALQAFDFRTSLSKITARTLVLSGKYDGLNPPERGEEIASLIPGSSFIIFENSGHAPNVEEPERFMQVITDFLLVR